MNFNDIGQVTVVTILLVGIFAIFLIVRAVSRGPVRRPRAAGDPPDSLSQDKSLLLQLNILKTRHQQPILAALTFDGKRPDFLWATLEWGTSPRNTYDKGAAVAIFCESKLIRVILNADTSKPSSALAIGFADVIEIQKSRERPQPGHAYEHFTTLFSKHKIYNQLSFGDTYQDLYAALRSYLPNVPVIVEK